MYLGIALVSAPAPADSGAEESNEVRCPLRGAGRGWGWLPSARRRRPLSRTSSYRFACYTIHPDPEEVRDPAVVAVWRARARRAQSRKATLH